MKSEDDGHFSHDQPGIPEGQSYFYQLDGGEDRADPCSLYQPKGVLGPSAVVRPERFRWTDQEWRGVKREDFVFYELHVGTFTPQGTFDAIIPRLDSLRELGITAIELMPIGQFPGSRNWGYDGAFPYAAQNSYGGPQGLQKLVDAAHAAGLAVYLDVVYNHLGPEACYFRDFGPYFTDKYKTPWGQGINYDDRGCDAVRDWALDNARMWLQEFHLDGLRLDAVHAIFDLGARHLLLAIREVAAEVAAETGRLIHVIAESDLNDPRLLRLPDQGGYGLDAQWSDDFHHAAHTLLTGEKHGYYGDYGQSTQLRDVLNHPYLFAWSYSPQRGRKHGAPAHGLSGDRFVVAIQNHDQVGNRAQGDRLGTILQCPARQRLAASLLLFSPYVPLLFMGEEYGETKPFPYFCSFLDEKLVQSVRDGRRREFADFITDASDIPDPQAEETFRAAKLTWDWPEGSAAAELRTLYADLLKARRHWSAMGDFTHRQAQILPGTNDGVIHLVRGGMSPSWQGAVQILFNLHDQSHPIPAIIGAGDKMLFSSEFKRYGGTREPASAADRLLPFECAVFGPDPNP